MRLDSAVGYRFNPNSQLKVQYSVQSEEFADSQFEHILSGQLTVKF
ncbi:MAG: hypothetical protein ACI8UO_005965 [Verrucomicrobiales bacterium]|jgi:hypothetical protein